MAKKDTRDPNTLTREEQVQRARSQANSELIEAHRKERDGRMAELLASWGYEDWAPQPTAKEKAAAKARELIKVAGLTVDDLGLAAPAKKAAGSRRNVAAD